MLMELLKKFILEALLELGSKIDWKALAERFDGASDQGDLLTCRKLILEFGAKWDGLKGWGADAGQYPNLVQACLGSSPAAMLTSDEVSLALEVGNKHAGSVEEAPAELAETEDDDAPAGMAEALVDGFVEPEPEEKSGLFSGKKGRKGRA